MTPSSLCQCVVMQRWPSVQERFQVRSAREESQRMVRGRLMRRERRGERVVVRCRKEVVKKARMERRETVRSWCVLGSGFV